MRITSFVLGALCLLVSAGFLGLGVLDLVDGGGSSSPSTVSNLTMGQAVVDNQDIDEFGPATTIAQICAIAGVAWMIAAAAFAPRGAQPAAAGTGGQWQPQAQQQPYTPQWQQPQPQPQSQQQSQPQPRPDQQG
jgi:hypothetical protein